ncbi:MAG: hypothetical protein HY812_17965 [Planctomycetes bacterium]|nr:hypothetical protein [Planctomycetota bacterium]
MTHASCSQCGALFDVSGKTPGSTLSCPKCGRGTVTVPQAQEALEELDASLEVRASEPRAAPLAEESQPAAPAERPRRRRRETTAPAGGPPRLLLAAGAAVVLAAAAGGYFLLRGDDEGAGRTPRGAQAEAGGAAGAAALSPEEELRARRARLLPGDLQGRLDLAETCAAQGLRPLQAELLREVLLLDANNATAREAFGYRRYDGPSKAHQGRWLLPADYELAVAAEALAERTSQ